MTITRRLLLSQAFRVSLGGLILNSAYARVVTSKAKMGELNLADFGGIPGAPSDILLNAFAAAFAKLKILGGGDLLIPPGIYNFGAYISSIPILRIDNLSNVSVSAYGAVFQVSSNAATPSLFCFHNPNNVIFAGAAFFDLGFSESAWLLNKRWGMYCVSVESIEACSNFKLMDCSAMNITGLYVNDSRANKFSVKNVAIENCAVTNAYYGVDALYHGDGLTVKNLVCENVRRGFISYGSKNVDMDIKLHCTENFTGSNGFISLACEGASEGNVENVKINLEVSGVESHTALVHFYHQQKDSLGSIKNVYANVNVNQLKTDGKNAKLEKLNIFLFDHELPNATILKSTTRIWDQITLSGQVTGKFSGSVIAAPTKSNSRGVLLLGEIFYGLSDLADLSDKFDVKPLQLN